MFFFLAAVCAKTEESVMTQIHDKVLKTQNQKNFYVDGLTQF